MPAHATNPVRREYERIAEDYDRRWRPYIDATLGAVVDSLRLEGRERVLDLACGTGELQRRLLSRWPELSLTGADLCPAMLRQAVRKDAQRRVTWIEADAGCLPLADASFDVAICANSFHYFRHPRQVLGEIRRVLRPGGALLLVDWCDDYLSCKLCSLWLRWTNRAFHRAYTLRACRALLDDAGLKVERAERFRIDWLWGLMRLVGRRLEAGPPTAAV